jgi:hypothetical protein
LSNRLRLNSHLSVPFFRVVVSFHFLPACTIQLLSVLLPSFYIFIPHRRPQLGPLTLLYSSLWTRPACKRRTDTPIAQRCTALHSTARIATLGRRTRCSRDTSSRSASNHPVCISKRLFSFFSASQSFTSGLKSRQAQHTSEHPLSLGPCHPFQTLYSTHPCSSPRLSATFSCFFPMTTLLLQPHPQLP